MYGVVAQLEYGVQDWSLEMSGLAMRLLRHAGLEAKSGVQLSLVELYFQYAFVSSQTLLFRPIPVHISLTFSAMEIVLFKY